MAYKALDVSNFIIDYCNDKDYSITNLRLQKMLYFIQAYYLSKTSEKQPLFNDEIQAWNLGPVVPSVYQEYKEYGAESIPKITTRVEYEIKDGWFSPVIKTIDTSKIESKDQDQLRKLIDQLSKVSTTRLVDISHQAKPWKDSIKGNGKISIQAMRDYYNGSQK